MGIVRDIITPILPVVLGIAIGAGGQWLWQYKRLTDAQAEVIATQGQRDALVAALTVAQQERMKAEQAGRSTRQAIYAKDQGAAAWARQPVPDVLAKRVRDAARAAQSATGTASSAGVSESP